MEEESSYNPENKFGKSEDKYRIILIGLKGKGTRKAGCKLYSKLTQSGEILVEIWGGPIVKGKFVPIKLFRKHVGRGEDKFSGALKWFLKEHLGQIEKVEEDGVTYPSVEEFLKRC